MTSITNQMRNAFEKEQSARPMLCGRFDPKLIKEAINDLELKGLLVAAEMDEWTPLDRLAYELLKQSAGIEGLKITESKDRE